MSESTLTKKQKFLAGAVCSLIVLRLVSAALYLIEGFGGFEENTLLISCTLIHVLLLLKFLLPKWEPHRVWLGCLLGAALLVPLLSAIYTVRRYYGLGFADWLGMGFDPGGEFQLFILVNPLFFLLLGVIFEKFMDKLAQIIAAILGAIHLALSLLWFLLWWLVDPPADMYPRLFLISLGYIILYFGWPILSQPILGKPEKEII